MEETNQNKPKNDKDLSDLNIPGPDDEETVSKPSSRVPTNMQIQGVENYTKYNTQAMPETILTSPQNVDGNENEKKDLVPEEVAREIKQAQ